jgi:hypothetical protein
MADLFAARSNATTILTPTQAKLLHMHLHLPDQFKAQDYFSIDGIDLVPTGFADLIFKHYLSFETCRLLGRLSQAWAFGLEDLPKMRHQIPAFAIAHNSAYAITNGFGTATREALEQCLKVALHIFAHTNWTRKRGSVVLTTWYRVSISKLTEWLPSQSTAGLRLGHDCLVWIWMILVHAFCVEKSTVKQGLACLGRFMIQFPTHDWNKVKQEILHKFFWSDEHSRTIENAQAFYTDLEMKHRFWGS